MGARLGWLPEEFPEPRHGTAWPNLDPTLLERPVPLHFTVREYLLELLAGGLQVGDQLPTELELMERFGVSRTPVQRALHDLVNAGVIRRRPGKGTFVAEPRIEQDLRRLTGFVEDMEALKLVPSVKVIGVQPIRADERVARHLDCSVGTEVTHIQRVRLANDEPISFDDTFLPSELGRHIARENLEVDPIFSLLEHKYGVQLAEAQYVIEAAVADATTAKHLKAKLGAPILEIERTSYATTGKPVDYERLYYRGDRIRYRMLLKR